MSGRATSLAKISRHPLQGARAVPLPLPNYVASYISPNFISHNVWPPCYTCSMNPRKANSMTISNPNPNVVGYVCVYCQRLYLPEETICSACNEFDGMTPITKNILAMFQDQTFTF